MNSQTEKETLWLAERLASHCRVTRETECGITDCPFRNKINCLDIETEDWKDAAHRAAK